MIRSIYPSNMSIVTRCPPPPDHIKMNVDANFVASNGFASVGVVASNSVGEVMISVELYCLMIQCGRSGASCVLGCILHRCHSVQTYCSGNMLLFCVPSLQIKFLLGLFSLI